MSLMTIVKVWDAAYTCCDVPIFTMVTTMTDRLDERNSLMARGRIFSGGMAVAGILCTLLISEKVGMGALALCRCSSLCSAAC